MPMVRVKARISHRRLEALEAQREPVAIGAILCSARRMDDSAVQPLQGVEHRAVVLSEQPLGYMQPIVRVDTDQMSIEGSVMDTILFSLPSGDTVTYRNGL
jgi:hypothetical protein